MDLPNTFSDSGPANIPLRTSRDILLAIEDLYVKLEGLNAKDAKEKLAIYAKQLDVVKVAAANLEESTTIQEFDLFIEEVLKALEEFRPGQRTIILERLESKRMDHLPRHGDSTQI